MSCCLSSKYDIFYVEDDGGNSIFRILNICCQCGNWMPAFIRCCGKL